MTNQASRMPKFGGWDDSQQQFTVIFDNMRADKSMKKGNPNDPAFLAELLNSSAAAPAPVVSTPPQPPSLRGLSPPKPSGTNHKNQSPQVPKFGEWGADGENELVQQPFTMIFDQMHDAHKNKKGLINPNDPEFYAGSAIAHAPSQPASAHESSQPAAAKPTTRSSTNHKQPSSQVPKFGEWNGVDGEKGEQQQFTLIFDNMHAVKNKKGFNPNDPEYLTDGLASSSSSASSPTHAAAHSTVTQPPASPLRHGRSQAPSKPTSRSHLNQKQVMAPKFGDWDVNHPQEFTAIFDDLKHERRHGYVPQSERPKRSTSPTTPLPKHKPFLVSLRLCFGSGHAVRE